MFYFADFYQLRQLLQPATNSRDHLYQNMGSTCKVVVPHFWRLLGPGHTYNFEELAWEQELATPKVLILKDFESGGAYLDP